MKKPLVHKSAKCRTKFQSCFSQNSENALKTSVLQALECTLQVLCLTRLLYTNRIYLGYAYVYG